MGTETTSQSGRSKKWFWFVGLLVVVLGAAYYVYQGGFGILQKENYQAVFLSNGQVYFGKTAGLQASFISLKDVYYLQVQQVQGQNSAQPVQQVSLAKLGAVELHKPKDNMKINKDHVLFIEDLDEGSQVVQAINNYKESLNQPQQAEEEQ